MIFWNSAEISLVFCQCKRSLQSRRYYSGFWSRGTWPSAESPDRGPRRNAHYTCTVKGREKSRMRTTYQNTSMRFGFFRACAFRAKTPNVIGFSGRCKRLQTKTQVFWILVFANVNGPTEGSLFTTFNSHSFKFSGGLRNHPAGSKLCAAHREPVSSAVSVIFLCVAISLQYSPFWHKNPPPPPFFYIFFYRCALKEELFCIQRYLFDAMDFSERCSEEMLSFFLTLGCIT